MEDPGPDIDGRAVADPTDLISPTLGCAPARTPVGPAVSVVVEFQFAFLIAAKVNRLKSFSLIPSDLREVSVSLNNATGVWWVLYLIHHESFIPPDDGQSVNKEQTSSTQHVWPLNEVFYWRSVV